MPRCITEGPYWLTCGHCAAEFQGTWHQFKHWRYEGSRPFCSPLCRSASMSKRFRKPKPQYGPCPTCGIMFESRVPKRFCSMKCYAASPEHPARTLAGTEASRRKQLGLPDHERYNRDHRSCLECGTDFEVIPSKSKKFCSHACYRVYMAKRFDRWIASPQRIALPQAYDEFLAAEELPCLVEACDWVGKHLSGHMNLAHGVPAEEFKRAAGFNITTGVVSLPLHQALVDRTPDYRAYGIAALAALDRGEEKTVRRYSSREGAEHRHKARLMVETDSGPIRYCEGCGTGFTQSTIFGRAKFCTTECRDRTYAQRKAARVHPFQCGHCGARFRGSGYQAKRVAEDQEVYCSPKCRQTHNSRLRARSAKERS
jgi:hypothetical protein